MKIKERLKQILRVCIGISLLVATYYILTYFNLDRLRHLVLDSGDNGVLIYILLWVILPIGFFPVILIAFVGGLGFGLWWGSIYTLIGASLNLLIMFFMARYMARSWIQTYLYRRFPQTKVYLEAERRQLNMALLLARLIPLIPYNIENYAFGLTQIRVWDYYWISLLAILPGTLIYVNVGDKALDIKSGSFMTAIGLLLGLTIGTSLLMRYFKGISYQEKKNDGAK